MYEKEIMITNPTGLHARPATLLVKKAEKYESKLELVNGQIIANPKSIFNVLAAGLGVGINYDTKRNSSRVRKGNWKGICIMWNSSNNR